MEFYAIVDCHLKTWKKRANNPIICDDPVISKLRVTRHVDNARSGTQLINIRKMGSTIFWILPKGVSSNSTSGG